MLAFLVGTGVWFTLLTRFLQVTRFPHVIRTALGGLFQKKKASKGAITPFQAVSTALAATLGTGNIVGVATAIVAGGPGAIFWMWVSAFFGMMTKYAEVLLAVKFRKRNEQGEWSGGPMYAIENGLGMRYKPLAVAFASFGMLAAFGVGNMTQVNSIAASMNHAIGLPPWVTGVVVAVLSGLVILGGVKRLGQVAEKIVPFMSGLYIVGSLVVLAVNWRQIGGALSLICTCAFSLKSAAGGALGFAVGKAMRYGIARGVFSNEAGLGSAPIAHASADTDSPARQGLFGVFEVFVDTLLICTMTALVILTTGALETGSDGAALTAAAYGSVFGEGAGKVFVASGILLFAYATVISWSLYGQKCFEYLFGRRRVVIYQAIYVLCIVPGAMIELRTIWEFADTLNGLMAIPNLIAILALSPVVYRVTRDYWKGLK